MTPKSRPTLLFMYDYFYPAYKAGGPIQSLTNLVLSLQEDFDIYVLTSAYDLNDHRVHEQIKINAWNRVILPNSTVAINVWYSGTGQPGIRTIKHIIKQINPSSVYLNGIFSPRFVMLPLLGIKAVKAIVCPRGMLQPGALAGKSFKKRLYLSVIKLTGLAGKVFWHATNQEEASDIRREFGDASSIFIAGNIPKKPVEKVQPILKTPGELRLVYLSLISEKKNLIQLIECISQISEHVSLDIYGPVKDRSYWNDCLQAISKSGGKVNYQGDVLPEKVQDIFSQYHASVLLTRGENFGHALYESLSAGRPIITSYFTPWNALSVKKAGWNVDISNNREIISVIHALCGMDPQIYQEICIGSYQLAKEYYQHGFETDIYKKYFLNN